MLEKLRALAELAKIDESTLHLERELGELPQRVAEMRADVERLQMLLQKERDELAAASELKASHESELANSGEQLARAKAKGAKARNVREVDAAEREMDAVRRSIRDREEEHQRLQEAIEAKGASLDERAEKLEEFKGEQEAEAVAAEARIEELQKEIGRIASGRDSIIAKLPANIVKRYGRIRKKIGTGVARVVEGTCQACRMHIPPQQFNKMKHGDSIENCPHCLRYIYVPSVVEPEVEAAPEEAEEAPEVEAAEGAAEPAAEPSVAPDPVVEA